MTDDELINGNQEIVSIIDNKVVVLFDPQNMNKSELELKSLGRLQKKEHQYAFDYVFDEDST